MLNHKEINIIRKFNRQYVIALGVLNKKIFKTDLSWPEGRILEEIAEEDDITPIQIVHKLKVDKGYTSRIISQLEKKMLIEKIPDLQDRRSIKLVLTAKGLEAYKSIDMRSNDQINNLIEDLSDNQQIELFESIERVNQLLFERKEK
ncbi:MarR family transcriptional regulator [Lactobacillus mulieris]|uniref:MarR family winged helix-turn-helix transcriptional regulator n=1 Tax=Lactobacillus mulieris TaxID=2508708 RepID=UPI00143285D9|nr:MarR family transcriptional regulator [Lactobacillus mulieris]MCF1783475.1 MarR family transcriptional regulator [Lactobacillus mulieris]MCW8104536.1 MarR family transcriptional regulator [Lactobacillus mulieris]MDK6803284.1 MarR family transcriptional regulator [Lactobacillus mulieris]MDK8382547.1 MarR family transcriptional regulator [Lactobacillus mulieris]MDT9620629.1 MarR family transcriptional regulator [Lactobacillus mulieris]